MTFWPIIPTISLGIMEYKDSDMGFSQKSVYALRAVFELAKSQGSGPLSISHIAEVQSISPRFLENILIQLKQAGLVESMRGKEGGYLLARTSKDISVGQVLRAIEGTITPVSCLTGRLQTNCPMMHDDCVFLAMWDKAHKAMLNVLDNTSFEELVRQSKNTEKYIPMYMI